MVSNDAFFVSRPYPECPPWRSPLRGCRVLFLDPDAARSRSLAAALALMGCSTQSIATTDELDLHLRQSAWEVVVIEASILTPDHASMLCKRDPAPHLVVMAADKDGLDEAEAMEHGAQAWFGAPLTPTRLRTILGQLLERRSLEQENKRLRESLSVRYALESFVTYDPQMRSILETVEAVADTRANVLLLGESGTGKSLLARAIHERSTRSKGPFVVVNCGAIPENLLESELFGHVRGAFTGAVKDKAGRFEQADGGTIFLDEVNSASLDLQVKLLRVIQDREFERVGDGHTRSLDVRLIAASNRSIVEEIAAGTFREDLYWRLNVVSLELPPLRERPRDVAHLAEHFLARFATDYGKSLQRMDAECLALLVAFNWPGNVRQLENVLERAVLLSAGSVLLPEHLGSELRATRFFPQPGEGDQDLGANLQLGLQNLSTLPPLKELLEIPERLIIMRALEIHGGNRKDTAAMLEVNRTTLFNKMKKYDLMEHSFEQS